MAYDPQPCPLSPLSLPSTSPSLSLIKPEVMIPINAASRSQIAMLNWVGRLSTDFFLVCSASFVRSDFGQPYKYGNEIVDKDGVRDQQLEGFSISIILCEGCCPPLCFTQGHNLVSHQHCASAMSHLNKLSRANDQPDLTQLRGITRSDGTLMHLREY